MVDFGRLASRCNLQSRTVIRRLLVFLLTFAPALAFAGDGPLGIDHRLELDDNGIWDQSTQDAVTFTLVAGGIAGAFWLGGETRFGRTLWQSIDASTAGYLTAETTKRLFSRVRPRDADDPDLWFEGGGNDSFPSGQVIAVTSVITPIVLEYRHDYPAIYALEAVPLYIGIARLKVQAHWQSDVLVGFAIGTMWGWFAHRREQPFVLNLLPDGFEIGLRKRF